MVVRVTFGLFRIVASIYKAFSVKAVGKTVECLRELNRSKFLTSSALSSLLSAIIYPSGNLFIRHLMPCPNFATWHMIYVYIKERKTMNKVYFSQIEVYSTRFGRLREKEALHSAVYSSHEEAHESGKETLDRAVRECYEASDYCDGEEDLAAFNDFIEDGEVYYRWTITEIDLDVLKSFEFPKGNRYDLQPPAHVEYEYGLDGELLQRNNWWYVDGVSDAGGGVCFQNREGDELPGAGTKFQAGDFVRLKRPLYAGGERFSIDQVFVVEGVPLRPTGGRPFENTYHLCTVSKWGDYLWDLDFHYPFQGIHESELVPHDEEVDENGALMFLSRLARGEINESEEIYKNLTDGKIVLAPDISWTEIPELAALAGEESE